MHATKSVSSATPQTSWYRIILGSLFGFLGVGLLNRGKFAEGIIILVLGLISLAVIIGGLIMNLVASLNFLDPFGTSGPAPSGTPRIYGGLIVYGLLALTAIVWEVVLRRQEQKQEDTPVED